MMNFYSLMSTLISPVIMALSLYITKYFNLNEENGYLITYYSIVIPVTIFLSFLFQSLDIKKLKIKYKCKKEELDKTKKELDDLKNNLNNITKEYLESEIETISRLDIVSNKINKSLKMNNGNNITMQLWSDVNNATEDLHILKQNICLKHNKKNK